MSQLIFHSELYHSRGKLNVQLEVLLFKEEDVYIAYAPALDISAFGNSEEEAKNDFGDVIRAHFEYCLNKRTLFDDLKSHGWVVKSRKRVKGPSDEELIQMNDTYKDIKENKDYKTIQREVVIPAM